jgi:hypothetical protein
MKKRLLTFYALIAISVSLSAYQDPIGEIYPYVMAKEGTFIVYYQIHSPSNYYQPVYKLLLSDKTEYMSNPLPFIPFRGTSDFSVQQNRYYLNTGMGITHYANLSHAVEICFGGKMFLYPTSFSPDKKFHYYSTPLSNIKYKVEDQGGYSRIVKYVEGDKYAVIDKFAGKYGRSTDNISELYSASEVAGKVAFLFNKKNADERFFPVFVSLLDVKDNSIDYEFEIGTPYNIAQPIIKTSRLMSDRQIALYLIWIKYEATKGEQKKYDLILTKIDIGKHTLTHTKILAVDPNSVFDAEINLAANEIFLAISAPLCNLDIPYDDDRTAKIRYSIPDGSTIEKEEPIFRKHIQYNELRFFKYSLATGKMLEIN